MKAVFFLALELALVAACAGRTSSSAGSSMDAADESVLVDASDDLESSVITDSTMVDAAMDGSGKFCLIPFGDGYFQCPADGMTVCPAGDGCNTCVCHLRPDGTVAAPCTTHVCFDG